MADPNTAVALAWSGGKDSALALHTLHRGCVDVATLMTTVTIGYDRVSMHGVRRDLVRRQAAAAELPLVEVEIPPGCTNAVYEERMARALAAPPLETIGDFAFGDLFLEDVRSYREEPPFGSRATLALPPLGSQHDGAGARVRRDRLRSRRLLRRSATAGRGIRGASLR